jgi:hypothetical protein
MTLRVHYDVTMSHYLCSVYGQCASTHVDGDVSTCKPRGVLSIMQGFRLVSGYWYDSANVLMSQGVYYIAEF